MFQVPQTWQYLLYGFPFSSSVAASTTAPTAGLVDIAPVDQGPGSAVRAAGTLERLVDAGVPLARAPSGSGGRDAPEPLVRGRGGAPRSVRPKFSDERS